MVTGRARQGLGVCGCEVGQRVALKMAPEHLDRIEVGGVRREEVTVKLAVAFEEPIDDLRSVRLRAIPNDDQGFLKLRAQVSQELHHPAGREVRVRKQGEVKSYPPYRRSRDGLFFNARPILSDPLLHGLFVPLAGTFLRLLRTPAHGTQQSADMMHMVLDGELSLDHVANPGASPQVRREPRTLCPFEKAAFELPLLGGGQLGRPAGSWPRLDSVLPLLQEARLPATDGAPVHLHSLRNIDGRESLLKQCNCLETALLELRGTAEWSHTQRIGH